MENGWIKLYRSSMDWEWYKTPNMFLFFTHCLMLANHKEGKWQGVDIKPGQFITGRKQLSAQTGLSEQSIRTCITRLKSTNEITIESTKQYSIITIVKWEDYQSSNQPFNQQLTNDQPTINQQLTTNNNDKNDNNEKNEEQIPDSGESLIPPPLKSKPSRQRKKIDYTDEFEAEWNIYPGNKKYGKGVKEKSFKLFLEIKESGKLEDLKQATKNYLSKQDNPEFIKTYENFLKVWDQHLAVDPKTIEGSPEWCEYWGHKSAKVLKWRCDNEVTGGHL